MASKCKSIKKGGDPNEITAKGRPGEDQALVIARTVLQPTTAGKATISQNAYKGGTWRLLRELSRVLREQNRQLVE